MNFINKNNNNNDTATFWKKEAKRLEKERNKLYNELVAIKDYRQNCLELNQELTKIKKKYIASLSKIEALQNEYEIKLQQIIDGK